MLKNLVITNRYYDSATLMLLTNKVKAELGLATEEIAVMMATDMNKRILHESGLLAEAGESANPGDVVVAIRSDMPDEEILALVERFLSRRAAKKTQAVEVTSVNDALEVSPESNFAVVSLPGVYAARETRKLLNAGKHVLLFSDNISVEDEVSLKKLAVEKDLLMMGPDCGTAIINGVGLGFSNTVREGRIGIVAASGTGLQEVATLISNAGSGISQAFGTGGRDIKDKVGGIMMLYTLDLLIRDKNTDVIVIVAKPPEDGVLAKMIEKLSGVLKPVVACFLGADPAKFEGTGIHFASTLHEAAQKALALEGVKIAEEASFEDVLAKHAGLRGDGYIRAIYCGGTLAYETLLMLSRKGLPVTSNLLHDASHLSSRDVSRVNAVIDMGDDEFTVGKPHPMIDPGARSERLRAEAADPEVSVIIADVELGYGSNDLAADVLASDVREILTRRPDIAVITVICGSYQDYQGYDGKKKLLEEAGAIVPASNAQAVELALKLLKK